MKLQDMDNPEEDRDSQEMQSNIFLKRGKAEALKSIIAVAMNSNLQDQHAYKQSKNDTPVPILSDSRIVYNSLIPEMSLKSGLPSKKDSKRNKTEQKTNAKRYKNNVEFESMINLKGSYYEEPSF